MKLDKEKEKRKVTLALVGAADEALFLFFVLLFFFLKKSTKTGFVCAVLFWPSR
jgi:hypothetical protein